MKKTNQDAGICKEIIYDHQILLFNTAAPGRSRRKLRPDPPPSPTRAQQGTKVTKPKHMKTSISGCQKGMSWDTLKSWNSSMFPNFSWLQVVSWKCCFFWGWLPVLVPRSDFVSWREGCVYISLPKTNSKSPWKSMLGKRSFLSDGLCSGANC